MTEDKSLAPAPKGAHSNDVVIKIEKTESLADLTDQQNILQNNSEFQLSHNTEFLPIKQEVILASDDTNEDFPHCAPLSSSLTQTDDSISQHGSSKKPFKCSVCDKRYSTGSNMYTHLKKQHLKVETKIHKCQFCDSAFEKLCRLKDHVRGHMGLGYECVICKTMLTTAASLKRHMKKLHQSGVSYKCTTCNLKFATPSGLEAHSRRQHSAKTLNICPVCEKTFKTRQTLKKHLITHPPIDPVASVAQVVVQEDMQVFTITELAADAVAIPKAIEDLPATLVNPYMNITVDQQIIEPEISQADTATNERNAGDFETLIKQENESDPEEVEFLSDKEESSSPPTTMSANGKNDISVEPNKVGSKTQGDENAVGFSCAVCANIGVQSPTLKSADDVLQHILSHKDVGKNHCTSCEKSFRYYSHLKAHINRVHLNSRPYTCPTCRKSFGMLFDLTIHMKRHLGIRPFRCSYCMKSFVSRAEAERHIRDRHLARKKCILCAKEFALVAELRLHIETAHLGLKAHKCGTCDMAFGSQFDLDRHEKLHLGIADFKCDSCQKIFSTNSHMWRHKRNSCNKNISSTPTIK